jgi:hypothetical protein
MGVDYFDNLVGSLPAPFLCRFLCQSGKGLVPGIFWFGLSLDSCSESPFCYSVAFTLEEVYLDSIDHNINRIQSYSLYHRDQVK